MIIIFFFKMLWDLWWKSALSELTEGDVAGNFLLIWICFSFYRHSVKLRQVSFCNSCFFKWPQVALRSFTSHAIPLWVPLAQETTERVPMQSHCAWLPLNWSDSMTALFTHLLEGKPYVLTCDNDLSCAIRQGNVFSLWFKFTFGEAERQTLPGLEPDSF